ncbi:MAG: lipocalin family protein [Steroidobacteraceae bacterium]
MAQRIHALWLTLPGLLLSACAAHSPLPAVPQLDLPRFLGDWYVIAAIPTWLEKDAYNAVESYSMRPDGRIQTDYRHRVGAFDGKIRNMHPIGTVTPGTGNAIWGMQFIWPIKAEYVIAWLDPEYRSVIIGRSKRDYVWIMTRRPSMDDTQYNELQARVQAMGYDIAQLRRVPQRWPEP